MGLIITFCLGVFILVGILFIKLINNKKIIEQLSISIALGTMLSLVIIDLIPEAFDTFKTDNILNTILIIFILVIVGIGILKLLDNFIPEHDNEHSLSHNCTDENLIHIGIVSSIAIIIHNIIEGMVVYSMSIHSIKLAILVGIGVGLHNIPMGMIIYSTLEKEKRKKRITLLFLVTISTFIGGLLMFLMNNLLNEFIIGGLICITLGMLIYIIIFELIPHIIHSKNKLLSLIGVLIGIFIIILNSIFE